MRIIFGSCLCFTIVLEAVTTLIAGNGWGGVFYVTLYAPKYFLVAGDKDDGRWRLLVKGG